MRFQSLTALILIATATVRVAAQQPSPTPNPAQQTPKAEDIDVVRITTNLVQVDAVVTDKNGKLVTDLQPDEIEIYEDGRKQKVTNFQYYTAVSPEAATAKANPPDKTVDKYGPPVPPSRLRREDVRRTIAIVVDDLRLSFESVSPVRDALKKFVEKQMQPGDLVAIVRSSSGMGALQQFTADKRQLFAAIERIRWHPFGGGDMGAFPSLNSTMPDIGAGPGDASFVSGQDVEGLREDLLAVGTLGAIGYVIRGLRELPGRKSVVLMADGLRLFDARDPSRTSRVYNAFRALTDQANRASVVIYTMDSRGLQPLGWTAADNPGVITPMGRMTPRPDQMAQQLALRASSFSTSHDGLIGLAEQTGGFSILNSNDLSGGIRRVIEDQNGYYLIGYRPDESTFDKRSGRRVFHHLSLKVTRPGNFKVRMRSGFFGISDEDRKAPTLTVAQQMVSALASPFGATGVHLQLTSLFANTEKTGSFMRSVLHIDTRDLTFTDEPNKVHKSKINVLAVTFGDNGVPVEQAGQTFSLELTDDQYKRSQREGLVYYMTVPIRKPGAYQLRMSLRDSASGRIGSASQFVEVPDLKKNRLALSGLTVMGAREQNLAPEPASQASQTDDGVDFRDPEASPAVRRFTSGMVVDYAFHIYNARVDKATNQPTVTTQLRLFRDGKQIFAGRDNPVDLSGQIDLKRIVASGRIQLGSVLTPGEYVAQVVVTDMLADARHRIATQWIDFEIKK